MFNWKKFAGGAAVSAIATAAIIEPAGAQTTSSSINGQVTDESGAPVSGATVSILHEPTGTRSTAITSANGNFFDTGLRVGGPYTIEVMSEAGAVRRGSINLQPSSNNLRFVVEPVDEARTLDTIVVRGEVGTRLDLNSGVGSVYGEDDIANQPTVDRDLIATLTRDPLAFGDNGSLSVAGSNPRFNALSIDGSLQQDDFGLSDQSYPTQRSPINLDAIEAVSLAATDYSVEVSGFTGGLVNVVTKSGSNEFDGSLFYYRRDEDYQGNAAFDQFVEAPDFTEEEYGFTLGGPILKDKLFFFVSYDEIESANGISFVGSDDSAGRDPELFNVLNQAVLDTYGIDMGGRPQFVSAPFTSEKLLGKIDWVINDDHRATFTYQSTEETNLSSISSTEFASAWYQAPQELEAYGAQLNSQWTEQLSTELRFNYKDNMRGQICGNPDSGEIDIRLDAETETAAGSPVAGLFTDDIFLTGACDRFRHANEFEDERIQFNAKADYIWNDHLITAGFNFEDYSLFNKFVPRSNGEFIFRSYDDLVNQVAEVRYDNDVTNDANNAAASWGYNKWSFFAQDSWQVLPELRVDYGLRYEYFSQDDEPARVDAIAEQFGVDTTNNLDGLDSFQPRVGFEYTPFPRTKITGGFGKFAGGDPKVWTSNAFQAPIVFSDFDGLTGVNPLNVPQVNLDAVAAGNPIVVDVISEDFEIPADWKASLRLDQEFDLDFNRFGLPVDLGSDYIFSAQYVHTETDKGFRWENLAQTQLAETQPIGAAPDGRPIYADLEALDIQNLTALTNFEDGASDIFTLSLEKEYDNGLGFFVSYANQDIESVTPGTSSRGISNWRTTTTFDRNSAVVGRSPFEVEHAFKVFTSYETEIFADLESQFTLFGTFTSGEPFSYTFDVDDDNSLFGRGGLGEDPFDEDLLYVPAHSGGAFNDPSVVFADGFDQEGFLEAIDSRGLGNGGIVARNSDDSPWNQRWDFQYTQELPFLNKAAEKYVGENRLNFVLDIENVANLLNDEWGTQYGGPRFGTIGLVEADLVSATDVAENGVDGAAALNGDAARTACVSQDACVYRYNNLNDFALGFSSDEQLSASVYTIRIGLRYEF